MLEEEYGVAVGKENKMREWGGIVPELERWPNAFEGQALSWTWSRSLSYACQQARK
jgi:hypothetical protein